MPFLRAQLTVIRPKVIVALGKLAHAFVLNISLSKVRIVRNMGKVLETPEYYAVMSCHPRFTVTTGPQNVLKEHLTLARDIAKGEKPICTARNAF
jgi:uracil-DNA glycosylase